MSDNRKDLRDKARQPGCEVILPQAVVPTIPVRPQVPCDPVLPEILPNTFVTPGGIVPVEDIPPTLDLISIGNDPQTVTCADLPDKVGSVGDPQTVIANSVNENFSWYEVLPALTNGQINYIHSLYNDVEVLKDLLVSTSTNAVYQLISYTHISDQQAISAHNLARAIKDALNTQAIQIALLQLECGWYNEEQVVECPSGALTTEQGVEFDVDAFNPSTITAGTIFSSDSLGDANTLAYGLAQAALKCVYGNDPQTITCADLFPSEPPVDSSPSESSVTKAANTYFSTNSKEEANTAALEAAEQELICYWRNDEETLTCEPDFENFAALINGTLIYNPNTGELSTEYTDGAFPQGNVATGEVGNNVVIAADLFTSTVSFEDAQLQAVDAGTSLLLCKWGNDPVKAQCPIIEIEDPNKRGLINPETETTYKVKVVPNLALSKPAFVPTKFLLGTITDEIEISFGTKTFTVQPSDAEYELQFTEGDLIALKPVSELDIVIEGILLIGQITEIDGEQFTVSIVQKFGNPLVVLNTSVWNNWQITLSQGSAAVKNSVLSDASKLDATTLAQGLVDGLLRCIYCNVQVDPRCLPLQLEKNFNGELVEYDPADVPAETSATVWDYVTWNTEEGLAVPTSLNLVWQVDASGVPLVDEYGFKKPLYQGNTVIDPGLIKDPQFSWSDDATLGVAAGKFCGEEVPVVQEIADNQLPVSFYKEKEDACIYCNDPVGADCYNNAAIRKEDPLDGSIFLPARTICVSSVPNGYEKQKYLISDKVIVAGTQNSNGSFITNSGIVFVFDSTSINLNSLGVVVGDFLYIDSTQEIKLPIVDVDSANRRVTVVNPNLITIPSTPVSVYVGKALTGTFSQTSDDLTLTISTPGFTNSNYDLNLNLDYVRIAGTISDFVINGKTAPNHFKLLNINNNVISEEVEYPIEIWKKDITNQPLEKQYATDAALDLAAALLQCISFNFACSSQVTRTCANIGKGTPADKLDPAGPITITLPKCFLSAVDESVEALTAQATAVAEKLLNCQFFNDTLILPCSTGVVTGGRWLVNIGGNVPARTFLESSYTSAQQKAITLVNSIANSGACIWTNNTIKLTCNDVGAACPAANRCAPTTVEIPTGTFIHVVNSLNYGGAGGGSLPDLDQQAIDYAKSLLLPICNICGNVAIPKTQLGCSAGGTLINFNKNVGANTFCASSQGAANAAANLLAAGNAQCLPEFATKDYVDQEITRKICIGINYVEDPVNVQLSNIESMRNRIEMNLTSLKASIEELNTKVNSMYVECVDGEPTLQGNTGGISFADLSVTPTIVELNITCPP